MGRYYEVKEFMLIYQIKISQVSIFVLLHVASADWGKEGVNDKHQSQVQAYELF